MLAGERLDHLLHDDQGVFLFLPITDPGLAIH